MPLSTQQKVMEAVIIIAAVCALVLGFISGAND